VTGSDGLFFLSTFTTVFVITDPPGNLPVFISLTSKMTPHERKRAAFQATMTSLGVMTAFGLFGHYILRVLGISVESMQISGGLLLAIVALQLLSGHEEDPGAPGSANVAMVPLGIPLMAGPGAIVAVMIAAREALGKGVVGDHSLGCCYFACGRGGEGFIGGHSMWRKCLACCRVSKRIVHCCRHRRMRRSCGRPIPREGLVTKGIGDGFRCGRWCSR